MNFQATPVKISDLADNTGEWLRGTGPESDIVISSRIRLARNVARFPFLSRANVKQKKELEEIVRDKIKEAEITSDLRYINLAEIDTVDRLFLVERHLISREHAGGEGERGVAFGKSETISLMVNEEDHLRIQVIRSGFELKEAWNVVIVPTFATN